jgi:ketose-bisphosphate aldolase
MTIANTLDLVRAGHENGYAVPAVNIVDDLSIRASIAAAEAAESPIIIQTSVKTVKSVGATHLAAIVLSAARQATVPVALHLDHCPEREVITEVLKAGWSSVLFDASDRPWDQALAETAEVVAEAHAAGVSVESEIENIIGVEDGVGSDEAVHAYSVEELADAAKQTGADMLAPQLGTSHGLYRASPELQFDRAAEVRALTDLPVVLHGGTGLTSEDFRRFIDAGVSKVNISTGVKLAYMHAARDHLAEAERTGKWEPIKMLDQIAPAVTDVMAQHIHMFGSAGAAVRTVGVRP